MRFMMIVKASRDSEAGVMPSAELIEAMGMFNNEMIAAGVMVDAAGLQASSQGARVIWSGDEVTVVKGPFPDPQSLIAGYWIIQADSLDDALDWATRSPNPTGEGAQIEIRPFFEPEAFANIASPELIAQEQAWREAQLRNMPKPSA